MLIARCEDSDVKVRDCCSGALATLACHVKSKGKSAADAHRVLMNLEASAPRVFKKMQAAMDSKAAPSATGGGSAPTAAVGLKKAASSAPAAKKASVGLKKAASTNDSSAATAKAAQAKDDKEDDHAPEDVSMSPEEAEEQLGELNIEGWTGTFQVLMNSAKWQDKVDALATMANKLKELNVGGKHSAALVAYLSSKTGNFKISNANILKGVIQLSCTAVQHSGTVVIFTEFMESAVLSCTSIQCTSYVRYAVVYVVLIPVLLCFQVM
jgi:hypothetical protein